MYGARDYLAHLGYGAMRLFQDDIIPYCHKYCTVPKFSTVQKEADKGGNVILRAKRRFVSGVPGDHLADFFSSSCRKMRIYAPAGHFDPPPSHGRVKKHLHL